MRWRQRPLPWTRSSGTWPTPGRHCRTRSSVPPRTGPRRPSAASRSKSNSTVRLTRARCLPRSGCRQGHSRSRGSPARGRSSGMDDAPRRSAGAVRRVGRESRVARTASHRRDSRARTGARPVADGARRSGRAAGVARDGAGWRAGGSDRCPGRGRAEPGRHHGRHCRTRSSVPPRTGSRRPSATLRSKSSSTVRLTCARRLPRSWLQPGTFTKPRIASMRPSERHGRRASPRLQGQHDASVARAESLAQQVTDAAAALEQERGQWQAQLGEAAERLASRETELSGGADRRERRTRRARKRVGRHARGAS